jgi:hypothetical protein
VRRHLVRGRYELIFVDQAIEKTELVQSFGTEAESERHLGCYRVWKGADKPVVVPAEQPSLGLRHLERGASNGNTQVGLLRQAKSAAHGVTIDRGDHRFVERAGVVGIFRGWSRAGGAAHGSACE